MSLVIRTIGAVLALAIPPVLTQTCRSFGIDFQDEGYYFQNKSSTDPFTFVSTFEGCQPDTARNLLVHPNGDELMCSDTNLTPDDVKQTSTCPISKDRLFDGEWSVLIISNNGNGSAIAYERDLFLTVGVPTTITTTPTITVTATTPAVVNATVLTTEFYTTTVTKTTERPWLLAVTKTLATFTKLHAEVDVTYLTTTSTASCILPEPSKDKWCKKTPTIIHAQAMMTGLPIKRKGPVSPKVDRRGADAKMRITHVDGEQRVKERKARLAAHEKKEKKKSKKVKRSPDSATVTVTADDTALFPTSTKFVTEGTSTMTVTDVVTQTATATVTELVVRGPLGVIPPATFTGTPITRTQWCFTAAHTTVTKTFHPRMTMTSIIYPAGAVRECKAQGGKMHWKHWKH